MRYIHPDHLDTTRVLTDSVGNQVASFDFFPFGELAAQSGLTEEVLQYTGHERDANKSGSTDNLDYMHARYYSPHLSRFLRVDPARSFDPKRPQSWNRYAYALNNPVRFLDPDGRVYKPATDDPEEAQRQRELASALIEAGLPGPSALAAGPRVAGAFGRHALPILKRIPGVNRAGSFLADQFEAVARFAFRQVERLVKPGGAKLGEPMASQVIRRVGGDATDAKKLFDALTGVFGRVVKQTDDLIVAEIPGVGKVTFRTISSTDGVVATIDIRITGIGIKELKFFANR